MALLAGAICGLTTGLLAWQGSFLGAMSLDLLAAGVPRIGSGPRTGRAPARRSTVPGVVSRVVVSAWEGLMFGTGVILGLTHRPRS